jgi:hypothetical protein
MIIHQAVLSSSSPAFHFVARSCRWSLFGAGTAFLCLCAGALFFSAHHHTSCSRTMHNPECMAGAQNVVIFAVGGGGGGHHHKQRDGTV